MNKYKLMIKTHNKTGLKYLCVTGRENYEKYTGSGLYWKIHLKEHGKDLSTNVIYSSDNMEDIREKGIYYSNLFDVVNSNEFANLILESGYDETGENFKSWWNNLNAEEKRKFKSSSMKEVWNSYSEEERDERVKKSIKGRLNMSEDAKEQRADKIRELHKSGKFQYMYDKYSEERHGGDNPNARGLYWQGELFSTRGDFRKYCIGQSISYNEAISIIETGIDETSYFIKRFSKKEYNNITCQYCNKTGKDTSSFKRWHLENCKYKA